MGEIVMMEVVQKLAVNVHSLFSFNPAVREVFHPSGVNFSLLIEFWHFVLLASRFYDSDCYQILHMACQLSCHSTCKILSNLIARNGVMDYMDLTVHCLKKTQQKH